MKLFYGLGNFGKEYENTRHNLGQMIIKRFLKKKSVKTSLKTKLQSEIGEWQQNIFATSTGYMNNSGNPIQKVAAFYKIPVNNIYLLHDDLDLPVGEWKLQFDRGAAGHNGVKSAIENLNSKSFWRLRIGIGHPSEFINVEDYVLKPFSREEKEKIDQLTDTILSEIESLGH